jgi:hypothetical protein
MRSFLMARFSASVDFKGGSVEVVVPRVQNRPDR